MDDYNAFAGTNYTLDSGRVLLSDPDGTFDSETIGLFGKTYQVEEIEMPHVNSEYAAYIGIEKYGLVISDPELIVDGRIRNPGEGISSDKPWVDPEYTFDFDLSGHDPETIEAVYNELLEWVMDEKDNWQCYINGDGFSSSFNNRIQEREDATGLFGGLFFLGLFMGAMFLMGTVLIIYYKQVSEGYEDAKRFDIMQKVGMSHQEVKRSIHSQVLMVFFLPLLMAIVHLCFAFPMLQKILMLMMMTNLDLILLSMAGCVLVFSVFYLVIYLLTARTYYKIVESAN